MRFRIGLLTGLFGGLVGPGGRVIMIALTSPRKGGNPLYQTFDHPT